MKHFIRIFCVLVLAMGLLGCGESDKRESISGPRGAGGSDGANDDAQTQGDFLSVDKWPGAIFGHSAGRFQDNTEKFVSGFAPAEALGEVNHDYTSGGTGVVFRGRHDVEGGFSPSQTRDGRLRRGALDILIWDSHAKENSDIQGFVITANGIRDYQWSGQSLVIEYETPYGIVALDGEFNNENFYGYISFDNKEYHSSGESPGARSNEWARFVIPACKFFEC